MIQVGDRLPEAKLWRHTPEGVAQISIGDLTRGRKIVLFAVPGAFTPTCSERHLPEFIENAGAIRAKGVDAIVCLAVNDPFVLKAWGVISGAGDEIEFVSDGLAELTRAIGLELDASSRGLGIRSQRYAMIVEDGVVRSLLIDDVPSKAEASSSRAILAALEGAESRALAAG
jgi:glutaredoxin/glutathione-dependent peroxiredoxin